VHVISFLLGGKEKNIARKNAREYLENIALASGGSFRGMDDKKKQ
jgi:hypothetical protein